MNNILHIKLSNWVSIVFAVLLIFLQYLLISPHIFSYPVICTFSQNVVTTKPTATEVEQSNGMSSWPWWKSNSRGRRGTKGGDFLLICFHIFTNLLISSNFFTYLLIISWSISESKVWGTPLKQWTQTRTAMSLSMSSSSSWPSDHFTFTFILTFTFCFHCCSTGFLWQKQWTLTFHSTSSNSWW